MQQRRRPGQELTQTAVIGAVPRKANRNAEVSIALQTWLTHPAWERGVDGDPSPVVGPALDDPRELVPEHQWMRELRVTDTAIGEPMQVRTTQTNRCYPNEGLARARGRPELIGDTHISHTVKPCHPHGRLTAQKFPGAKPRQRGATPQMLGGTPPATRPETPVAILARSSVPLRLHIDLDPRPKVNAPGA